MSSNRIIYQNWIVDLGRDPDNPPGPESVPDNQHLLSLDDLIQELQGIAAKTADSDQTERTRLIISRVTSALEKLSEDEREFVGRFHFIGQSYRQISERSGRGIHRLEAIHKRAFRKLRKELAPTVKELFGVKNKENTECIICSSCHKKEIDSLISARDPRKTWRPVMKQIKERFGITITTPQILMGHVRYH